jgi:tetratricopeptide (TPR) repeat protein
MAGTVKFFSPLGKFLCIPFPGTGMASSAFLIILVFFTIPHASLALEKPLSPPLKKPANHDVLRGIELLYNLEFEEAERVFATLVSEKPKKPMGYFYMAMVSWSRLSIGFWTPQVLKEYVDRIDLTISVAKKRIENREADSFDYFYLGGALGFKGRFELMQHNWFSSYTLAYEAIEALRKCAKLDPSNVDVLLGLGIYDYYTAKLSGIVKLLSYLFLYKGNKEEGLRKLQTAADHAVYSAIESKSMLLHIYLFMEEDFQKALPFAKELSEKFSKNPRYKFLEGIVYIRGGLDDGYGEVLNFIRAESARQASRARARLWANQATYLEASYHLFRGQPEQARAKLDAILARVNPIEDPAMAAWPLLKKGMSYDLQGQRNKALNFYKDVLSMENAAGAQFLAEKYIDEAPEQGDPFLGY